MVALKLLQLAGAQHFGELRLARAFKQFSVVA